jgi:hypothetical protein
MAVYRDTLILNHGIFRQGGYLSASDGQAEQMIGSSPDYNFQQGYVDEEHDLLFLAGWNEKKKEFAVYSFDGSSFSQLKTMSGTIRPTSVVAYGGKLFVATNGLTSGKTMLVFNLDDQGKATFVGLQGKEGYSVKDFELYKDGLYAVAFSIAEPTNGEVWVWRGLE